jgi:hypothetical protein
VTVEREGDTVVVCIPMAVKRVAGRKQIVVPQGLEAEPQLAAQEPIVVALARAYCWQERLDTRRYSSITELAAALNIDRKYVARILSLAFLAPDIVEAIVAGREPSGLSLEKLAKGFPLDWTGQRKALLPLDR